MYVCANAPCENRSKSQADLKEAANRQMLARATIWQGNANALFNLPVAALADS
jgi:hypothetical protein